MDSPSKGGLSWQHLPEDDYAPIRCVQCIQTKCHADRGNKHQQMETYGMYFYGLLRGGNSREYFRRDPSNSLLLSVEQQEIAATDTKQIPDVVVMRS